MALPDNQIRRRGSCLCGALRWAVSADPVRVNLCHCSHCSKVSGSAYGFYAAFSKQNFHVTEPTPSTLKTYYDKGTTTGTTLERSFCSECGSTMFSKTELAPDLIIIAMGTADNKEDIQVATEFWTSRKVQCIPTVEGVTSFEGNP